MPCHHDVATFWTDSLVDQDPIFGCQVREHGISLNLQQQPPATKKQQQILVTCCCQWSGQPVRIQVAVTQASLRPFDCQNMPWIFDGGHQLLCFGLVNVDFAGAAEFDAFQKVSCRSGNVARCSG